VFSSPVTCGVGGRHERAALGSLPLAPPEARQPASVVWLPGAASQGHLLPDQRSVVKTSSGPPPKPRVLLAEDDAAFRSLMAAVLRSAGYEVLEAADGTELLDHVAFGLMRGEKARTFDVVVADIRMPGHTGLEVLNGMRSVSLAVPVILITAFGDAETHRAAYEMGARVLDKPFDLGELEHAVAAALAHAGIARPPDSRRSA